MTLKDIAKQTGVSASTVSRILSGKNPKCAAEEVKARVWAAAREGGYIPTEPARQLKAGGGGGGGIQLNVLFSRSRDDYNNQFFNTLEQSIGQEALRRGCRMGPTMQIEKFFERQREPLPQNVGAVVMGRCSAAALRELSLRTKKLICVGLNPYEPGFDQVICNGRVAAEMAVEYLFRKGHLRIGYVGDCENEVRYIGYRNILTKNSVPFARELVYETAQTEEGGRRAAPRVLQTADPPTALFCVNDATAIGVLAGMRALQPEGPYPALISVDNIGRAEEHPNLLTTISIPIREMGFMAVKLLLDRMEKGHSLPIVVEFPCNLIKRQSG